MNNEEKARAYDKALNWMRAIYPNLSEADKEDAEHFFPQLAESEDERIRKALVKLFQECDTDIEFCNTGFTYQEILVWLEKQKINTEGDFGRGYECGYEACLNSHGAEWFEKQKHPNGCFTCDEYKKGYEEGRRNGFTAGYNKAMKEVEQKEQKPVDYEAELKKCKDNPLYFYDKYVSIKQKPAEWSEEDEEMLNSCISSIEESKENRYAYKETDGDTSYDREVDWLESLRNRVGKESLQSWKPSEEQMDVFDTAAFQKGVQEGRRLEKEDAEHLRDATKKISEDLALTINDIEKLHTFLYAVKNNKQGAFTFTRLSDEQYKEVLRRFNKTKEQ